MMETEIKKKTVETLTEKPTPFSIDIPPRNQLHGWLQKAGRTPTKREFVIKPLTTSQVYRISEILLDLDAGKLTADDILKLFKQLPKVAEIIAIAVTPSREQAPKELIRFFLNNLRQDELQTLTSIILGKMQTTGFLISILSLRNLNVLQERSPQEETETIAAQTRGSLSVAS